MKTLRNFISVAFLLTLCAMGTLLELRGQAVSVASVTGRVVDGQGAVITGALIKMVGVDTGTVSNSVSNSEGLYAIQGLSIGAYTLESTVPGFQTHVQKGIVLRVGDQVQIVSKPI